MTTVSVLNFGRRIVSLSWLTGPIFDKELRVSSRRRRNYALRFAYLSLLTSFLALFWLEAVSSGGGSLSQVSQMAEAGKSITSFVIWFQFIAAQFIALIMLSNSISDEVYNRTLGLLMTTPINSFQIVIGKLLSKLLQIVLILGISLPLLAIVRVFGGVRGLQPVCYSDGGYLRRIAQPVLLGIQPKGVCGDYRDDSDAFRGFRRTAVPVRYPQLLADRPFSRASPHTSHLLSESVWRYGV